jgi:hypothetical protein
MVDLMGLVADHGFLGGLLALEVLVFEYIQLLQVDLLFVQDQKLSIAYSAVVKAMKGVNYVCLLLRDLFVFPDFFSAVFGEIRGLTGKFG